MSAPGTGGREEEALLASPRSAAFLTVGVATLTAVLFVLVGLHGTLAQSPEDRQCVVAADDLGP